MSGSSRHCLPTAKALMHTQGYVSTPADYDLPYSQSYTWKDRCRFLLASLPSPLLFVPPRFILTLEVWETENQTVKFPAISLSTSRTCLLRFPTDIHLHRKMSLKHRGLIAEHLILAWGFAAAGRLQDPFLSAD